MESCRRELGVDRSLIDAGRVHVLDTGGGIIGFYSLEDLPEGGLELGHLFVEPGRFGTGVGRLLVEHACRTARVLGFARLVIQGDPHAEGFYVRCGAVRIGDRESASIPGRMLPVFEMRLDNVD
jgi:GNAT superfamily N-acetyltransferase